MLYNTANAYGHRPFSGSEGSPNTGEPLIVEGLTNALIQISGAPISLRQVLLFIKNILQL